MLEKGEIVIIDNKEYVILSLLNDDINTYIYLESMDNPKKPYIGKMTSIDNFETLSDRAEIEKALIKFNKEA